MSIKMLVMDVDGTLTDGRLYIGAKGELMKSFDVKDGYAIAQLKKNGIEPVIITGRKKIMITHFLLIIVYILMKNFAKIQP